MSSKTILDCCPELQQAWPKILAFVAKKHKGYRVQIVETHVPPEEQQQRFNQGRNGLGEVVRVESIVTDFDGTEAISLHNYYPSKALRFRILNPDNEEVHALHVYDAIQQLVEDMDVGFVQPNLLFSLKDDDK
jgi:hypothetical protein